MQLPNGLSELQFRSIEKAMQAERLGRYMAASNKDKALAFEIYIWNCELSETFYFSLHFAEVVCRNAIHFALVSRFSHTWFEEQIFLRILDKKYADELANVIEKETRQHDKTFTAHHVVSALSFGFWEHLTAKRFERLLWAKGIHHCFPNAPKNASYQDLQKLIESVRRWRNRIAHYQAIFDKGPSRKHQDTLDLIKWVCVDSSVMVGHLSKVTKTLALRPK